MYMFLAGYTIKSLSQLFGKAMINLLASNAVELDIIDILQDSTPNDSWKNLF